jgi:predicted nucleotidyltransferase
MSAVPQRDGCDRDKYSELLARVLTKMDSVRSVMLYGSYARGTASFRSDIDILALVDDRPQSLTDANLAITAYRADHLRALARNGSLFVLHLIHDGVILYDTNNELTEILASYRPPTEPSRLSAEFAIAASGLIVATSEERRSFGESMQSLAFYLLRTAVYSACALRGEPQFDTRLALGALGLEHLAALFEERREKYDPSRLDRVLETLPTVLPGCGEPAWDGLAATAVAVADTWPLASDLLAYVLAGKPIDYTALSLPVP